MQRAHRIALDPTLEQERYFRCACGVARFAWNWGLAEWKRQRAAGEQPSGRGLKKQFNAVRHEQYPWSGEVLRDATARPFDNLQRAFGKFFQKKARYPRFKKKGVHDSFYVANDKFATVGRRIRLPHIGWVRMREALRFEGKVLAAVVSRTADRWFVAVSVELPEPIQHRESQAVVGVDLGIKALATLSTGEQFAAPKPLGRDLTKLARLQRQLSRKQKGSQNRAKARMRVARLHARIANVRQDALHKLTTALVQRYGVIAIEDLNVLGMQRNRHLARAISDVGWGEFRRQVAYKAEAAGVRVVVADRWYPSSKTCSACGFRLDILPLSIREWECPRCGIVHERDVNAAVNLEQLGRATPEVTPVESEALAVDSFAVQPRSGKQELGSAHEGAQKR